MERRGRLGTFCVRGADDEPGQVAIVAKLYQERAVRSQGHSPHLVYGTTKLDETFLNITLYNMKCEIYSRKLGCRLPHPRVVTSKHVAGQKDVNRETDIGVLAEIAKNARSL